MRNTEINREGRSPLGQLRTEITFTDSWGDQLKVDFNPQLRRVYMYSGSDGASLSEDQMMTLVTETARFFSEDK